jgi:carboxymethylenebutenolidase
VISQSVTIDVGGSPMPCYLARPGGDGTPQTPVPAVIVLQEIFGVNAEVQRITDLVASAGYVGLAINYYHRTAPDLNEPYTQAGLQAGFAAAGAVTRATLAADLTASVDWLNAQDFVHFGHIATWGFCFGGTVAFFSATLEGVNAAIAFYGGHIAKPLPSGEPPMLADAAQVKAPLLLAFGGEDDNIPMSEVEQIRTTLTADQKRFQLQIYPTQGHAFFRDSSKAMAGNDDTAACVADAWGLVQAFLTEHLS